MLCVKIAVLFIVINGRVEGKFYKTNLKDFSKCKVHYSRSEDHYKEFYEIADEARENDAILDFHFSVLASSDAHILLAPSSQLHGSDPVYEIVLGAGGNTFSDIRRMQKSAVKASARVKDLLSAVDIRSFWLHISQEGLIEVGRETEELAFLAWMDVDPLPLKVFSFSTWPGVEAKWFYNCQRDNITTDSKEVEVVLSDLQRLRRDLLLHYSPFVRPVAVESDLTLISMDIVPQYVSLDEREGLLYFKAEAKLHWFDEKLVWSSEDYGGIDTLELPYQVIWNPDLTLYNSPDPDVFFSWIIFVNNFGVVTRKSLIKSKTWCDPSGLGSWPSDCHTCNLKFGFWRDINGVQLQYSANQSNLIHQYGSEWNIIEVDVNLNYGWQESDQSGPPGLAIQYVLKRQSNVYKLIYFTPFLVIATAMLATFWVSPFGNLKITLASVQIILSAMILLRLATIIPGHPEKVPNILSLYTSSLIATTVTVGISILVINISRNDHKYSLPHVLCRLLRSPLAQTVLILPNIKNSKEYGKLTDVLIPAKQDSIQTMWILFGTAIERVAFLIFLIVIILALCIRY